MKSCICFRFGFYLLTALMVLSCSRKKEYIYTGGQIFGTYYSITYLHPEAENLQVRIEQEMQKIDLSLSTFNPRSVISAINRNDSVTTDILFETMFLSAQSVSEITHGAFDITVAPLVNAWGFGFGDHERKKIPDVQSLLSCTGYRKVKLQNKQIIKADSCVMLDASAIAKGYAVDVIANLLAENGCKNYMVEIGGEVRCKGKNPKNRKWRIGIEKPELNKSATRKGLHTTVSISDAAIATSGNYRQFYSIDGKQYSHTIDPRTGYPANNNLLSVTVIAPTCIQADAYATAFMVLGVDSALHICGQQKKMECYLIYTDSIGSYAMVYTSGFEKYLHQL